MNLPEIKPLRNKICLVTGATSGLGKASAQQLAQLGATVILVGRSMERCAAAAREIKEETGNTNIEFFVCDLSSFEEIRIMATHFKQHFNRLDALIHNAAAIFVERTETDEGLEATLATNYLGPFLLTHLLLDALRASRDSRIINVTCDASEQAQLDLDDLPYLTRPYHANKAYAQTKLMNVLFTAQLDKRLSESQINVCALNPGTLVTELGLGAGWQGIFKRIRNVTKGIDPAVAAEAITHALSMPDFAEQAPLYFIGKQARSLESLSHDEDMARSLWTASEELTGANETVILGAKLK